MEGRVNPHSSYNPFDPIQDTESFQVALQALAVAPSYNPFDPIQDTESTLGIASHSISK